MSDASPSLANIRRDPVVMSETDDTATPDFARLFEQYWDAVLRRKWLIGLVLAACVSIGIIVTLLQPKLYTAGSRIEISRDQKNITNVQGIEKDTSDYDEEFYDTQYALLKAQSLGLRVARTLRLADQPSFFAAGGVALPGGELNGLGDVKTREGIAAGLLLANVKIAPVKNSSLIDISYTSRSPQWSAAIANAWPQQFVQANTDRKYGSTLEARRMLEERLRILRGKLEESERNLIAFGNQHDIITFAATRDANGRTTDARTLVASNLEALNSALMAARSERIAAESRARTPAGDSSADVLQSGGVSGLRAKRADLAADYSRMLTQFDPAYPAARALRTQIDALDRAIASETARINRGRQTSYAEALKRENELAAQVAGLKADYLRQQQDTTQYNIFQREVDTNRQLYDGLLQRYKEIGVAGTVAVNNVAVVDGAQVPGGPSSPSLMRNLAIAFLVGAGLAAAIVFALEQFDDGIRLPSDVEQMIRLPLLGSVPTVLDQPIDELADPKAVLSEAYASVRAALALATSRGFPKTLVVTSTEAREGKSITAMGLAMTLGRSGRTVLLVDGDMRSPSVHHNVNVANQIGLSNILAGEQDLARVIQPTEFRNVSVVAAGPPPPSAAELLSSDRFTEITEQLAKSFDHIVIDAPPVLGLADAVLLGRAAEGVVFVIKAESTSVRAARAALHRVQMGTTYVFGAVLTQLTESAAGYGREYLYGEGDTRRPRRLAM
jgi:capsular exopolysaccharide synthesis family protein